MKTQLTEPQRHALKQMPHKKLLKLGMPRHEADKLLTHLRQRN